MSGMVDFESSANVYVSAGFSSDSLFTEGRIETLPDLGEDSF
jgi:hypothetical protein